MPDLFTPLLVGDLTLPNRVIMAPLTRGRAVEKACPNALMAEYYSQRASAGLIITEATAISAQGLGWINTPGCYNDAQEAGWANVANAVHRQGGRIFMQLWHMGALVHPDFTGGEQPISASPIQLNGTLATPGGGKKESVAARELSLAEIKDLVEEFSKSAARAMNAGMDGVEIHAANGFLIDQFTRDGTNKRSDRYGGSAENRSSFLLDVVEAVSSKIGARKVGVRLSPTNKVWGISDSNPTAIFTRIADLLNAYNIAYLHLLEPKRNSGHPMATDLTEVAPTIRGKFKGPIFLNGGLTKITGEQAVKTRQADAAVYGIPYIANPDLVERFQQDAPLTEANPDYFYSGGEKGYTDYASLKNIPRELVS